MAKDRARILILSALMSFPTIRSKDWNSTGFDGRKAEVGDLVSIDCAPPSKWYLSWLREYDHNNGMPRYLLESVENGELCWWSNIGISYYNRERFTTESANWQWTDEQFKLCDRWYKVCKNNDDYMVRPRQPVFNDDGSVILNVRIRHSLDNYQNPKTFENWKKLTMKQMDAYYKDCVAGYDSATST